MDRGAKRCSSDNQLSKPIPVKCESHHLKLCVTLYAIHIPFYIWFCPSWLHSIISSHELLNLWHKYFTNDKNRILVTFYIYCLLFIIPVSQQAQIILCIKYTPIWFTTFILENHILVLKKIIPSPETFLIESMTYLNHI